MITINRTEFLKGIVDPNEETLPLPEIAVFGRSNVGKSTLINRLTNRKNIARTSGTPGKTREVNIFKVELSQNHENDTLSSAVLLLDLPGFGYAKTSKVEREAFSRLVVEIIRERPNLSGALLLNDSKRKPEEDELAIQRLCFEQGVQLQVVATKIDRLNQSERNKALISISSGYGLERGDILTAGEKQSPAPILNWMWENARSWEGRGALKI